MHAYTISDPELAMTQSDWGSAQRTGLLSVQGTKRTYCPKERSVLGHPPIAI